MALVMPMQFVWHAWRESSQLQFLSAVQLLSVLYAYLHSIRHVVPVLSHIGCKEQAVMSKSVQVSVHCCVAPFHMQSGSNVHGCCV